MKPLRAVLILCLLLGLLSCKVRSEPSKGELSGPGARFRNLTAAPSGDLFAVNAFYPGRVERLPNGALSWEELPLEPSGVTRQLLVVSGDMVLLIGGVDSGPTYVESHAVFRWQVGDAAWKPAGLLRVRRQNHGGAPLADGVLVFGGTDGTRASNGGAAPTARAERFSLATGKWTAVADMHDARFRSSSVVLADGRVLVAGGCCKEPGRTIHASAEIFDPKTNKWTPTQDMSTPRRGHALIRMPDDKVMAVSGHFKLFGEGSLSTTEVWDPSTGLWTAGPALQGAYKTAQAAVSSSGAVLVMGSSSSGPSQVGQTEFHHQVEAWVPGSTEFSVVSLPVEGTPIAQGASIAVFGRRKAHTWSPPASR